MIFLLHLILILCIYLSPFILDWRIILVFVALYYIQLVVFGNCILTIWQFREEARDTTFYSHVFELLGFSPNKRTVRLVVDYVIPWAIVIIALLWQVFGRHSVFLG